MPRLRYLLYALLLIVPLVRVAMTYAVFSQTIDEPVHVSAGVQWWSEGRYDLDREHPPLARIAFGLGPYLDGAAAGDSKDSAAIGTGYFYRDGLANYTDNMARARCGNLVFLLLLMVVTAVWMRHRFGDAAALVALAILGALPPVLGHAGLATTDLAITATLPLALFAYCRWVTRPTWRRAVAMGGAVGVAMLAKFSFLLFFPLAALGFAIGYVATGLRPSRAHVNVVLGVVVALLCVWAGYRFQTGTLNEARYSAFHPGMVPRAAAEYARVPGYEWVRVDILQRYYRYGVEAERRGVYGVDFVDWAKAAGYPSPMAGRRGDTMRGAPPVAPLTAVDRMLEPFRARMQWVAMHVPLPGPDYIVGAQFVAVHSQGGHQAFFLGEHGDRGWWSYFPVLTFFKTPLALVLLAVAAIPALLVAGVRRRDGEAIGIALVPLAVLLPAMTGGINIGVRHVLPLFPFLVMAAAVLVVDLWRRGAVARGAVAVLLGWYFVATTLCHPDYLAYFNEAAGGHPERIALDSNLDWGQDLLRLAAYAREHPMDPLYVEYFGSGDWQRHMPRAGKFPRYAQVNGWIAISEMAMEFGGPDNRGDDVAWLNRYKPVARIGSSIRLYYIP